MGPRPSTTIDDRIRHVLTAPRPGAFRVLCAALVASILPLAACSSEQGGAPTQPPTGMQSSGIPASPATTSTPPLDDAAAAREALQQAERGRIDVPESAGGVTVPITLPGRDSDRRGRVVRYTVEIEKGLEGAAVGFPLSVRRTLTDEKGWETADHVHFVHVTAEQVKQGAHADIRILFASPRLTDERCKPARTLGRLSCHNDGQVMINAWRWVHGAETYGSDLADYRIYLVNHEVGHSIGHMHEHCPRPGARAPLMLQQTLRLEGCRPYPYPVR